MAVFFTGFETRVFMHKRGPKTTPKKAINLIFLDFVIVQGKSIFMSQVRSGPKKQVSPENAEKHIFCLMNVLGSFSFANSTM